MSKLTLKIITPTGLAKEEQVEEVIIPAIHGEMGILPEHISVLAALNSGFVRIITGKNKEEKIFIKSGVCQVENNICKVLAEEIIDLSNQSKQDVESQIKELDDNLKSNLNTLSEKEITKLQSDIASLEILKAAI
jgi:F-type H+-transporting ATPase subunit epsilon